MSKYVYLYRARVVAYPEGSHTSHRWIGEDWPVPVSGWKPEGWVATDEYIDRMGTDEFVWPVSGRHFKNRSTVKRRVELLHSFGAEAVLERSSRIIWPGDA